VCRDLCDRQIKGSIEAAYYSRYKADWWTLCICQSPPSLFTLKNVQKVGNKERQATRLLCQSLTGESPQSHKRKSSIFLSKKITGQAVNVMNY
jgi:hypothetical protein